VLNRTSSEPRSAARSAIAGLLVASLVISPSFGLSVAASPAAASSGALAVTTDPSGASVYIDEALVGRTPLSLDGLAAGEHQVRISKPGYLENRRTVRVEAGVPLSLELRLTPDTSGATTTAAAAAPGDSIFANKWFWVGVAGAGGAAAFVALSGGNEAPTLGGISASRSVGLAAATTIAFSAQGASDPDGDSLSYAWDFGNGATSTSANATQVYNDPGTYTVRLTVSDGDASASRETSVTIRSLTGTWTAPEFFNAVFTLTQNGSSITGSYIDDDGPGTISGSVQPGGPQQVIITVTQPQFDPYSFFGDPNNDVSQIVGTIEGAVAVTLRRQ
jgi:hypothetical protein